MEKDDSAVIEFDKIDFVGRKEEIALLRECVESAVSSEKSLAGEGLPVLVGPSPPGTTTDDGESTSESGPILVLVSGFSGVGKTSLISEAIEQAQKNNDATKKKILPAFGKFEQLKTDPLSALDDILCDICRSVSEGEAAYLRGTLKKANMEQEFVGNLTDAFPTLSRFFDEEGDTLPTNQETDVTGENENLRKTENDCSQVSTGTKKYDSSLDRLKYAFHIFVKALCSCIGPIALVLDDVQWSDPGSLELLRSLVSDTSVRGLVVIASYRDNEVEDSDPVGVELRHLEREAGSRLTRIQLSNHNHLELNVLFADLLQMEQEDVESLTKVVYLKTHGNVFYSIQLLRFLVEKEIVYSSPRWLQWEWDVSEVQQQATVTENVVYLVEQKIRSLPDDTRSFLQLASCLGARFDIDIAFEIQNIILHERSSPLLGSEATERISNELLQQMLMLRLRPDETTARFGHDIIQHAAYSMLTENDEHKWMHLRIGWFFQDRGRSGGDQDVVAAASHLNLGVQLLGGNIVELEKTARINLEAAKVTKTVSAFSSSLSFAMSGLDQIPGAQWNDPYYDLTLDLNVLKCELLYCLGKFDECLEVIDKIEANARTVFDRSEAIFERVRILGNRYEFQPAMENGLSLLKALGENFPHRPSYLRLVYSILVTQKALSEQTYASILELPTMTDQPALLVQKSVSILTYYAFIAQNPNLVMMMNLRAVRRSLQFGISKYSAFSFAAYGYLLSTMGKFEEAFWWGHTSLELQTRFNDYVSKTSLANIVYPYLYHLRRPIEDVIKPLLSVYTQGMRSGELQWAASACNHYVQLYLYVGLPLSLLAEDLMSFIDRVKLRKQRLCLETLQVAYQTVLNLRGKSDDPLRLSGIAMQEEQLVAEITSTNSAEGSYTYVFLQFMKFLLHYVLEEYETAFDLAYSLSDGQSMKHRKQDAAGLYVGEFGFHSALIGIMEMRRATREANRRKAFRFAQIWLRFLENWMDRGVDHAEHKVLLLRAEMMRTTEKKGDKATEIESTYEEAIASATKAGFVLATAIAAERAAEFYFDVGKTDLAHSRVHLSYAYYLKWEATVKMDMMVEKYSDILIEEGSALDGSGGQLPINTVAGTCVSTVSGLTGDES